MAAIYDELGNVIGDDGRPSPDEMRYELAKSRDYTAPIKAAIQNMPGSAFVQGLMPIINFPGQILGATAYGVGKQIADPENANFNKDTTEAMRATYYTPPSNAGKEYQEALMHALEASKLPPYIGHMPPMRFNANDARVLAKQNIERAREFKNIPEDFSNAKSGFQRESNLGGQTYGAQLQGAADEVGDVMARRQARGESAIPGVQVFSDLVPETNLYAVKPVGGQLVKSVDPVTGQLREVPNSSVAGISNVYENIRKQTEGQGLINQYLRTFVNRPGIQDIWNDFNAKKVAEEFPGAPTPDQAREAFTVKYPTAKSRNERMTTFFDEFAALPQAQALAADLGVKIPTFEEYQARITAANQWAQKAFPNYIQKFVGTKEDPALQLATQGITFKDPAQVTESATDALNYASPQGLREDRVKAGFNPEGEIQPFLKEKLTELKAVDDQLREMVMQRNNLYEQARTQNVDPMSIPGYPEMRNKIASKTAEKERITQQAENYKLGKSYETLADLAIEPRSVKDLNRKLTFAEKQLFPYLDKTPEDATLYDIHPTTIGRLGLTDMATQFMDDIVAGKIPVDQITNVSIPKYIQETAMVRAAKEAQAKKDKAAQQKIFNTYLEEQVQQVPSDKIFSNAAALEMTNAMDEKELMRHMSTDTVVLDHCLGQGGQGSGGKQYLPMLDPVTGEVPKGSSGNPTSYVRNVMKRGDIITSLRDIVTGSPVGTIELQKTGNNEYDIGYASGYQNGRMDPQYTESLKNYLNSKAEVIRGSGDNLTKNGLVDQEAMRRGELRDITGLTDNVLDQLSYDGLPRFLSRNDIIELNNQRKAMLPSAQLNSEVATLNNTYADLLDENQQMNFSLQNADDDLAREDLMSRRSEIQSQLTDVNGRLNNLPIEDVTNFARELINDIFPENKKTPRARLQYLDDQSPILLRVQPRVYDTMREILRDQRDAVGAPLSDVQQRAVMTEWRRVSEDIARSINGSMYNGRAVAGNIRRNPDRYNLGEYSEQIIDGIARRVEENGIIDPRNAVIPLIRQEQSTLPNLIRERLNNLFGNLPRGAADPNFEQAIMQLQQYQEGYQNPGPNSVIRDLTESQRLEGIGEIQRRIEDLQQRAQRQPLINSARPQEQRQDLAVVVDRMHDAIAEEYGQPVAFYVRDALETINYNVNEDGPLYIERVRQMAAEDADDQPVRAAFNMVADRLVEGVRANVAAYQAERAQLAETMPAAAHRDIQANERENQIADMIDEGMELLENTYEFDSMTPAEIRTIADDLRGDVENVFGMATPNFEVGPNNEVPPAFIIGVRERLLMEADHREGNLGEAQRLPNTNVGNVVQNLINQYPERNQIQALINDFEHGEISELPIPIQEADEIVRDDTVSQIIEQLEEYRDSIPAPRQQLPAPAQTTDLNDALNDSLQAIRGVHGERVFNLAIEYANEVSRGIDLTEQPEAYIRVIRDEADSHQGAFQSALENLADDLEAAHVGQAFDRPQLPAPEARPNIRHGTDVMAAYYEILRDNNQFRTVDEINALRALPQLIRRPGATRNSLGIGQFDTEQANQLARIFEALYEARRADFENQGLLPPPEGHKDGGSIQSSKNRLLSPNIDEMRLALMKGK